MLEKQRKDKVVNVRVSAETKNQLDELARITKRSRAFHLDEAIAAYLQKNSWQIQAIQEAVDEADSGTAKWISHEEIEG